MCGWNQHQYEYCYLTNFPLCFYLSLLYIHSYLSYKKGTSSRYMFLYIKFQTIITWCHQLVLDKNHHPFIWNRREFLCNAFSLKQQFLNEKWKWKTSLMIIDTFVYSRSSLGWLKHKSQKHSLVVKCKTIRYGIKW